MKNLKHIIFLFIYKLISASSVCAMNPPNEEIDKDRQIICYLKEQGVDLADKSVEKEYFLFNPARLIYGSFYTRRLEDRDLQSTAVRGFLLGFSKSIIQCSENSLYNLFRCGAEECGKQIGENYIAPNLTFAINQLATLLVYNTLGLTESVSFLGKARAPVLSLMSLDRCLNIDTNKLSKELLEQASPRFRDQAAMILEDLQKNEPMLKDFVVSHCAGNFFNEITKFVDAKNHDQKQVFGFLGAKEISKLAQLNKMDILNNATWDLISSTIKPITDHVELVTSPVGGIIGEFTMHYFVKSKLENINFGSLIEFSEKKLNGNFKTRYEKLEIHLDPVFCKLGEKYAQNLMALCLKPVAEGFNKEPFQFVTCKIENWRWGFATLDKIIKDLLKTISELQSPPHTEFIGL